MLVANPVIIVNTQLNMNVDRIFNALYQRDWKA